MNQPPSRTSRVPAEPASPRNVTPASRPLGIRVLTRLSRDAFARLAPALGLVLALALALALPGRLAAQPIPDALHTAGTTALDARGRPWAYLAFRPTDDRLLLGRSLAVHLKAGLPSDPGTFTRQAVVAGERDPSVLAVLIERGRQLGEDVAELNGILDELYRARAGGNAAPETLGPAEKLGRLLGRAEADAETAQLLRLLGQAHPSVKMALGEAWAGPLPVAPSQPVTLEVREVPAAGEGGVVGRVVLAAGQPVLLPPPGPPIQVPDLSPKGDLNVKLRWGQDDDLRRLSPLVAGFTLWRVARPFAAAQGVGAAAPALAQLQAWFRSGDATRVSDGPLLVSRALSLAQAADVGADPTHYFVVDDGRRYRRNAAGQDIDSPEAEGAEYTYFVCTRDLLGRDGPPSLPGYGVFCRTLPPPIPSGLRAENHWEPDAAAAAGTQSIQFSWRANENTGRDVTDYYEVYRGTDLTQLQSDAAKDRLRPLADRLDHPANGALLAFLDTTPEILGAGFGETFWYSVRAVHASPCGPIRSDFAAPVLIARRQREGPSAPRGFVDFDCHRASVVVAGQRLADDPALPANDGLIRLRILCQRLDPGIAFADLALQVGTTVTDLGRHVYAAEGDWVAADFAIHRNELAGRPLRVTCQATTHSGARSHPREFSPDHLGSEGRREVTFQARTLTDADLVPGDPFSEEWLEPPISAPALAAPDGTTVVQPLPGLEGRKVVVETSPLAVAVPSFTRHGGSLVRDGAVFVSLPPVPEGQAQPALTARVHPVREPGESACLDLAYHPGTGRAGRLGITLFTTPRSAEYRLFRRINEGPYTLVGQGAAEQVAGGIHAIRREDDALPATDCTICYYAQTVDRDGNASALVRLEPCVERRAPTLPKPNLSPPEAAGTTTAAKMKLTWACPPPNVERFLVTIKARGGAAAQSALERASAFSLTAPLAARVVQYHSAGGDLTRETASQAAGPADGGEGSDSVRVLALASGSLAFQKMIQTSSFLTPPLGRGYPGTPPFTAEFDVQPGIVYSVFVQAVRGPLLGGQGRGPASSTYEFRWEDPARPDSAVPWPFRPLASITTHPLIQANELHPVLWPAHLDGQRPVGVRLATLPNARGEDVILDAGEVVFAPTPDSPSYRRQDPNAHLLGGLSDGVNQVQGVILYRQQVANELFPAVPGDTVQVSPLIRKVAWIPVAADDGRNGARLIDPFFALTLTPPPPESPEAPAVLGLWLLDNQGVVNGARYHYYLVCLGPDGEIRRTLDAGFYGPH